MVQGEGRAPPAEGLEQGRVASLRCPVHREPGGLGPPVDAVASGDRFAQWDKRLWEQELTAGLKMRHLGVDAHLIAGAHDLPLMLSGGGARQWR